MILGVDHIALSCVDIIEGTRILGDFGYSAKFIDKSSPNRPAKKHLLRYYESLHALTYCVADSGIAIELTRHSNSFSGKASPYHVLLSKSPIDNGNITVELHPSLSNVWREAFGCTQPKQKIWTSFNTPFWYDAQEESSSKGFIRAILLPVSNIFLSEKFWCKGLGCKVLKKGATKGNRKWISTALNAPVPGWSLIIVLTESTEEKVLPFLDDPGFSCLAFISNRMTEDKNRIIEMGGHDITQEFKLKVDNKDLRIVILRGPDNELVELIEIQRS